MFGFLFFIFLFITHHSSLNFRHSSLKTPHPFGTITHLSSLNIFQLFVGLIPVTLYSFYFLSFFLQPPVPKLTKPSKKKKRIQPTKTIEKKEKWRRKKKKWSKVATDPHSGSLYVCLITKILLKTKL